MEWNGMRRREGLWGGIARASESIVKLFERQARVERRGENLLIKRAKWVTPVTDNRQKFLLPRTQCVSLNLITRGNTVRVRVLHRYDWRVSQCVCVLCTVDADYHHSFNHTRAVNIDNDKCQMSSSTYCISTWQKSVWKQSGVGAFKALKQKVSSELWICLSQSCPRRTRKSAVPVSGIVIFVACVLFKNQWNLRDYLIVNFV